MKCSGATVNQASRSSGRSPARWGTPRPPPTLTSPIGIPASFSRRVIRAAPSMARSSAGSASVKYARPTWKWTVSMTRACRRAASRVDPEADGAPRRPPSDPFELAQQVDVDVDRMRQDDVEIALGHVRPRVADLLRCPAVLQRVEQLPWRARVDTHAGGIAGRAEGSEHRQRFRCALGLQGQPNAVAKPGPGQSVLERSGLLLHPDQVVCVQRGAVISGQRLPVPAGDAEPTVADLEAGPGPPGTAHRRSALGSEASSRSSLHICPIETWMRLPSARRRRKHRSDSTPRRSDQARSVSATSTGTPSRSTSRGSSSARAPAYLPTSTPGGSRRRRAATAPPTIRYSTPASRMMPRSLRNGRRALATSAATTNAPLYPMSYTAKARPR